MTTEKEQNLADAEITLLKVGFIGTGGTGKTTVANLIRNRIPEPFVGSRNREVFAQLGYSGESFQTANTAEQNWKIQHALITAKVDQDVTHPVGLFDRTPIDHIAYCLHRCADAITDSEWDWLWNKYSGLITLYDILFYFPIYDWENAHEDGFRQTNKAYRTKIDFLMQGVMAEMGICPVFMPNESPEQRADIILLHLKEARESKASLAAGGLQRHQDGANGG